MLHGLAKRKSPRLMAAVSMAPSRNLRSLRCLWARRGWLVWTTTEAHDVHVTPKIPWDPNAKDLGFLSNDGRIHPSIPFLGDTWHFFPHPIASFSAPNPPKLFGPICSHWKSEWWRQPCFSSELPEFQKASIFGVLKMYLFSLKNHRGEKRVWMSCKIAIQTFSCEIPGVFTNYIVPKGSFSRVGFPHFPKG